jgi:ABC-type amino acid transport substrate-binding protein
MSRQHRLPLCGLILALGLAACEPGASAPPSGTAVDTAVGTAVDTAVDTAADTAAGTAAGTPGSMPGGLGLAPEGTLLREIQDRGKLVCGAKSDLPMFGHLNPETGQVEGFDVEVCKAIAAHILGSPESVEIKEAILTDRIPLLQQGAVDVVASTLTVNADRLQEIDFSNVYFVAQQALLVPAASPVTSLADLSGKRVGTVAGSTSEPNIAAASEQRSLNLEVSSFDTYPEAVAALQAGSLDAVTADDVILFGSVRESPGAWRIVADSLSAEPYGVGLPKGEPELLAAVNAVIDTMKTSGAWQSLYVKWLPVDQAPEPPPDDWQALSQPSP